MTFFKTFLRGKLTYLAGAGLFLSALADFAEDRHTSALDKALQAAAIFGVRRAIGGK